ncbi:hypothetical protein K1719_013264 [Acacia pycnantha]|nr:hypothetical protein K1719_013264 [Acacia pycnantha]
MGRHSSESPPPRVRGRSPVSSSRRDRERERERERDRDRERSPSRRHSHSHKQDVSPVKDRSISPPPSEKRHHSSRGSVRPARESSGSPVAPTRSRSPSPLTKRLRRAQADRESELNHGSDRGTDRDRDKDKDRGRDRGRGSDRNLVIERKEKRSSGRDEVDDNHNDSSRNRSSRSRHERPTTSPEDHRNGRNRHRSPSPPMARDEMTSSRGAEHMNDEDDSVAKMKAAEEALEEKQKHKPSFELSGKLAAETNRVRGVTLLFNEPPEARKPDVKWRLYVFKGGEVLNEPLYIHRQSCYLFGRERRVADIPTDHPSCSKQHAVIQFRQVEKEQPDGMMSKRIRPYLMDLGSTNKTFLNDSPIEPQRYYELREKDTIKFGNSSREYVLLHENSIG